MESVVCKQERALKGRIITIIIFVVSIIHLFMLSQPLLPRLVLFFIATLVFGFSVSYRINKDFKNQKLFSVFGITLFRSRLDLEFPDYISVFSGSFSLDNDWGAIGALGTKERHDKWVVRFFKENRKFTLFKTNNYQKAIDKGNALSNLLGIEIYDNSNE